MAVNRSGRHFLRIPWGRWIRRNVKDARARPPLRLDRPIERIRQADAIDHHRVFVNPSPHGSGRGPGPVVFSVFGQHDLRAKLAAGDDLTRLGGSKTKCHPSVRSHLGRATGDLLAGARSAQGWSRRILSVHKGSGNKSKAGPNRSHQNEGFGKRNHRNNIKVTATSPCSRVT